MTGPYSFKDMLVLARRVECEKVGHLLHPSLMSWAGGEPPVVEPVDSRGPCSRCDALITVTYPDLGKA